MRRWVPRTPTMDVVPFDFNRLVSDVAELYRAQGSAVGTLTLSGARAVDIASALPLVALPD